MNIRANTKKIKYLSVLHYILHYTIQNIEDYKVYNEISLGLELGHSA